MIYKAPRAIVESSTQQDASALHNKLRKTDPTLTPTLQ